MKRWTHGGPNPFLSALSIAKNHSRPSSNVIISTPSFSCRNERNFRMSPDGNTLSSIFSPIETGGIVPPNEMIFSCKVVRQCSLCFCARSKYLVNVLTSSQWWRMEIWHTSLCTYSLIAAMTSCVICRECLMRNGGRMRTVYCNLLSVVRCCFCLWQIIWTTAIS